jgi:peptidoglycan/xylan/chitin deacetylase (PgdA/CDA1 family)
MSPSPCWVVFYHYLREPSAGGRGGIRGLDRGQFAAQLDWLAARGDILDYEAFRAAIEARRGFARPSVLLTFDDGLTDHREVAFRELASRGLSGVFFVNGDPLDERPRLVNVHRVHMLLDALGAGRLLTEVRRVLASAAEAGGGESPLVYRYDDRPEQAIKQLLNYELPYDELDRVLSALMAVHFGDETALAQGFYLSRADVREMAAEGMTFGYHTRRHRVLSRLDAAAQRDELAGGVECVRALTGQRHVPFCYPYGHVHTYDETTVSLLRALGYDAAFTTGRRPIDVTTDDRFRLPRFDTVDFPPRGSVEIAAVLESPQ